MGASLTDFLDFVVFWMKKRTGLHPGKLVVFPAMVRHCLCCQKNGAYSHAVDGLCTRCCAEVPCGMCGADFTPSGESLGIFCPGCWTELEGIYREAYDASPSRAELLVRTRVSSAQPSLTSCPHGG